MAVQYRKPVDDNVPWDQRLANYAGNKDAGKSEYQRALEVNRAKSALGDTTGADAAKKWADQVNTAIGGIGDNIVSNRTDQINKTTDTIGQKVNATPFEFKQSQAPFQYNARNDESYQAALRQAQRGAQTATNNAMVGLGSRGIGNSSVAVDRANQIQQSAIGNVNDTILPQLMAQAYTRYQDQNNNDYTNQLANYNAGQDQIKNLTGYAGTLNDLNQQEGNNQYRDKTYAEAVKSGNWSAYKDAVGMTGNLGTGPKSDWGQLTGQQGAPSYQSVQDAIKNGMTQQQIDNSASQFAAQMGYNYDNMNANDRQAWAQIAISQQNADNSTNNANQSALYKQWEATGLAPAGIPGVEKGTPLYDKTGVRQDQQSQNKQEQLDSKSFATERDGMIAAIRANKVNVNDAMTQINQDEQMGVYTPDLAEKLRSVIRVLAGTTKITNDPKNNIQVDMGGYGGYGGGSSVTGDVFGK